MTAYTELLRSRKNFIFLGETGSGKSEIALNTAAALAEIGEREVHLFDLDQTKAMFRARDAEEEMAARGVVLHYMPQLLDTPVMVNGILPQLIRPGSACILDVGGNENAARMIGCLSDRLKGDNTAAFWVMNPFRPWSRSEEDFRETERSVLNACHLASLRYLANPTTGPETGPADLEEGLRQLEALLPTEEISGCFVPEALYDAARGLAAGRTAEILPLHRYLKHPWQ